MRDLGENVHIAFDHRIFAYQTHGGVSRYFAGIIGNLPRHGIAPKVLAPLHVNAYLGRLPPGTVWGWRVPPSRVASGLASRIDSVLHRPLAAAWRSHIVHETYFGAKRLAPNSARIALTVYDMIHELFPHYWPGDATIYNKRRAIERADRIICISESTRRDLIDIYPDTADRAVVTLLGYDQPPSSAEKGVQAGRPYLLYVGQRGGYKNFAAVLKAYAASPALRCDFDLLCIGGGPFSPEEQEAIAGAGLTDSVRQESADNDQLQQCYRSAALFVYPSRYEGFGIPPLEAMAAGCPVAASNASSIPEVCGAAVEYFDPDDVDSIGAAIEAVALSAERAETLRVAGHQQVSGFSWDKCAAETAVIYRSMM